MLGRDTSWRQGCLISQDAAIEAGLYEAASAQVYYAIVVSHDCDLANDHEPELEIIVGEIVSKLDKQFSRARNVRRLQLTYCSDGNNQLFLELLITGKQLIQKSAIVRYEPDGQWQLPDEEKRALKQWLAARYGRPAFPNAFEAHLRKASGKKTVETRLGKLLEADSKYLIGVFFDLDENRGLELEQGTPYDLRISIVYDALAGGQDARQAAEKIARNVSELFEQAYGTPDVAIEIALESCEAVADTHFSLADLRKVDQWRVEYISLRQDPPENFLALGEMPG